MTKQKQLALDISVEAKEPKAPRKSDDHWVSQFVGTFFDPIIVHGGGWADSVPDWLKQQITIERLLMNVVECRTGLCTGTDAEACAYLMTASLCFPFDHEWTNIYLYVAGKTCTAGKKLVPDDIKVESLDRQEMYELNRLKEWIYRTRVKVRQERDRAQRREEKAKGDRHAEPEVAQLEFEFSEA